MNRITAAVEFLGLKKSIVAVLTMAILVGLGEHMAERFLPLYLGLLGGGALSIGLLNGLDNLLSALYSFPGGYLSDRLGYKRALLLFNLFAMIGFLLVIVAPSWYVVIIGALFFISWSAISLPATMEAVASILPRTKRTMGVTMHSMVRRIPMAAGPLIGGALISAYGVQTGVRIAFVIAFAVAGVSAMLQQVMITAPVQAKRRARLHPWHTLRQMSPALRNLLVSDILIRFCEQIPYAFVVIWCVELYGLSAMRFGVLTAIEMVTAMLVYIPVAYLADKGTKKPFVVATFAFFTLFPLALLGARTFWVMVLVFVLRGMKEFGEPTRKALIMDLAPEDSKATMFGAYYLVRDTIVSLAAFGGALLWNPSTAERLVGIFGFGQTLLPWIRHVASPTTNLLTAFGFGVLGTLYFALFGKNVQACPALPSSAAGPGSRNVPH